MHITTADLAFCVSRANGAKRSPSLNTISHKHGAKKSPWGVCVRSEIDRLPLDPHTLSANLSHRIRCDTTKANAALCVSRARGEKHSPASGSVSRAHGARHSPCADEIQSGMDRLPRSYVFNVSVSPGAKHQEYWASFQITGASPGLSASRANGE